MELNEVLVYQKKIIAIILSMLGEIASGTRFHDFHFNIYTHKKTLFTYFPISGASSIGVVSSKVV